MSFAFIPRKLAHSVRKPPHTENHRSSAPGAGTNVNSATTHQHGGRTKEEAGANAESSQGIKSKYSDTDYANLLCLALSDHALWSDPDLRRALSGSPDGQANDGEGFITLSRLLKRSQILSPLRLGNSQTAIVKALRSCAADMLEVRLLISDPSTSAWLGTPDSTYYGGYEVRRKDWEDTLQHPSQILSRGEWDKRTIYVECIPVQYRTIPGIARFIQALLSTRSTTDVHQARIQNIILPPHHLDNPGDQPKCKGFALVVLGSGSDVEYLLSTWPWVRTRTTDPDSGRAKVEAGPERVEVHEAAKFSFRALSKLQWDKLKEEYLDYRKRLVDEINAFEDAESAAMVPLTSRMPLKKDLDTSPPLPVNVPTTNNTSTIDISSPYPYNSLVFVRNIHPETNKTTLRRLFAAAFTTSLANGELQGDGLDYVDFNKGMDSCHLRLATPKHAQILIGRFSAPLISQSHGLDDTGKATDTKTKAISMDLVLGRREELYWEKVPEKVRRQAVQKAIALASVPSTTNKQNEDGEETRQRKKQKR